MPVRKRCLDMKICLLEKGANDTGIQLQWLSRCSCQCLQQIGVAWLQFPGSIKGYIRRHCIALLDCSPKAANESRCVDSFYVRITVIGV